MNVPAGTDAEQVKAPYKSGILEIRLPKPTLTQHEIAISGAGRQPLGRGSRSGFSVSPWSLARERNPTAPR
jgi:hypothetical protein